LCIQSDFGNYLSTIIGAEELPLLQRQTAAVLLKSLLERKSEVMLRPWFEYIKIALIKALCDVPIELARAIGNCISTIVWYKDFNVWPNILSDLASLIKTGRKGAENAIICLEEICEDMEIISRIKSEKFEVLIPLLISIARDKEQIGRTRGAAIYSLTFGYITTAGGIFEKYINEVIKLIFELIQEIFNNEQPDEFIEKHLCGLSIIFLKDKREGVIPICKQLFDFHMKVLGSRNYEAACAGCDFWQIYLKTDWSPDYEEQRWKLLKSILPELIPQLLLALCYSDTDLSGMVKNSKLDVREDEEQDGN